MKSIALKKLTPHLTAILLFIAISFAYMSPLLEGKKLKQGDISNYQGMAKEDDDYSALTGEQALWTNTMFSGMPTFQISYSDASNLVIHLGSIYRLYITRPADFVFLYLIGFYLLLISLGFSPWLSVLGAVGFGFSSYFFIIIEAGHNTKVQAIALMAPVIAGVIFCYKGRFLLGGAIAAIFTALEINAGHYQVAYYLILLMALYIITELIRTYRSDKDFKRFGKATFVLAISALIAVGTNISGLLVTYEYTKESTRGKSELSIDKNIKSGGLDKDYITGWSYGVDETFTLLIPDFKGGATGALGTDKKAIREVDEPFRQNVANSNHYWGNQPFTSGPVYAGAIICFLFVLGLFIIKGELKWWLASATALSVALSWGKNFMPLTDIFIDYFPLYNKFRAVTMILVIAQFAMVLLAVYALNEVLRKPQIIKSNPKPFIYSFLLTGGLALFMYLFPGSFNTFISDNELSSFKQQMSQEGGQYASQISGFMDNLETARKSILRGDAMRSFIFALLGAGLVWLLVIEKYKKEHILIALTSLILIDHWAVDKRYLNNNNFVKEKLVNTPFAQKQYDLDILKRENDANQGLKNEFEKLRQITVQKKEKRTLSQDELLDIQFQAMRFGTHFRVLNLAVNTFNDASTSYYHKSIGGYHGAKMKRYQELIEFHISKNNMDVLNMLNTKYYIVGENENGAQVIQNPEALGNAWFVENLRWVADADSEITALSSFNPEKTAIIDQRFEQEMKGFYPASDSGAFVQLTQYKPHTMLYESNSSMDGFVVFSEIYYAEGKGWSAYIDGKPKPHIRVNYVLRGMIVPAGKHTIEFKFEPDSVKIGGRISFASSLLLILLASFVFYKEIKKIVTTPKNEK